jgi:hypothetical protein
MNMTMSRAILGVLLALAGCHNAAPASRPATCAGTQALVVRNESREAVDVYVVTGPTSFQLIGTAATGHSELALPPGIDRGATFRVRRGDGGWITTRDKQITFNVECR